MNLLPLLSKQGRTPIHDELARHQGRSRASVAIVFSFFVALSMTNCYRQADEKNPSVVGPNEKISGASAKNRFSKASTLTVTFDGAIAFVPTESETDKTKFKSVWAIAVNAKNRDSLPAGANLTLKDLPQHFAVIRAMARSICPGTSACTDKPELGDLSLPISVEGYDISFTGLSSTGEVTPVDLDAIPHIEKFSNGGVVCSGCTDKTLTSNTDLVATRLFFERGTFQAIDFVVDEATRKKPVSWSLNYLKTKTADTEKEKCPPQYPTPPHPEFCMARLAQRSKVTIEYAGTLIMHLTKFRANQLPSSLDFSFSGSNVDLMLQNLPAADLLGFCPVGYSFDPLRIDHFSWFYGIAKIGATEFRFPETSETPAVDDPCLVQGGRPYCSNAFLTN